MSLAWQCPSWACWLEARSEGGGQHGLGSADGDREEGHGNWWGAGDVPRATSGSWWLPCVLLVMGMRAVELGTPEVDCSVPVWGSHRIWGDRDPEPSWVGGPNPPPHTWPSPGPRPQGGLHGDWPTQGQGQPSGPLQFWAERSGPGGAGAVGSGRGGEGDVPTPAGSFPGLGSGPGSAGFGDESPGTGPDRSSWKRPSASGSARLGADGGEGRGLGHTPLLPTPVTSVEAGAVAKVALPHAVAGGRSRQQRAGPRGAHPPQASSCSWGPDLAAVTAGGPAGPRATGRRACPRRGP